MGGTDNIAGIDFQISYGVYRLLGLISQRTAFDAIRFEEPNDEGQDLSIYYPNKTTEIVQVKKRGEAYLWTPSSVRPVIEKFIKHRVAGGRYVFFSDGSLNNDMIEIRDWINRRQLDRAEDEKITALCQSGESADEIRALLKELSLNTRQFVSNDASRPGDSLRLECQRMLSRAPFTPLLDTEKVFERLWNVVFNASRDARYLSPQEISDLFDLPGLMQRPQGAPIASTDATTRRTAICNIEQAIRLASNLFVYGISGTGKSTLISQFLSANSATHKGFWTTISSATTTTTIRQSLAASLEDAGITACSEILRNPGISDLDAIKLSLKSQKILCVLDAVEKSTSPLVDAFKALVESNNEIDKSVIIFAG